MSKTTTSSYKGYIGSAEISLEDNCLHGRILFIDDLISYEGQTPKELEVAFKEAVDRYIEHCSKTGKSANKPYSGSFNVRITPELHRSASQYARKNDMSLNEFVGKAIQTAIDKNGVEKVEHVHSHRLLIAMETTIRESRVATTASPKHWEEFNGTPH